MSHTASESSRTEYQTQVCRILYGYSIFITSLLTVVYVYAARWQPDDATRLRWLMLSFSICSVSCIAALLLLNRGHLIASVRIWIAAASLAIGFYGLLMPAPLMMVSLIGILMVSRAAYFFESIPSATAIVVLWIVAYVTTVYFRQTTPIAIASLPTVSWIEFVVPASTVFLYGLTDMTLSRHLGGALRQSESARRELQDANALLEEQKEDLRRANEEVRSFAYILSHDLRGPLINIRGFAGELRKDLRTIEDLTRQLDLDETKRATTERIIGVDIPDSLHFIDSSVEKMDHYINSILGLSRLGRRELKPVTIDVREVVGLTLKNLEHAIEERGVDVDVGPMPVLDSDRVFLEQIFGNLLQNAVNYLDSGRRGRIRIRAHAADCGFEFAIEDNGRGMREQDIDRAFEFFQRIGTHDVPGSGMGLPAVQVMVKRLGGRVWCESREGAGSCFHFTIGDAGERRAES